MSTWFEQYLAARDSKDTHTVMQWFTTDIVFEDVVLGHKISGSDRMTRFVEVSLSKNPNAYFDFVDGRGNEEAYWIEWVMQPIGVRGVSVGTLRNGKICANRDYWKGAPTDVDALRPEQ